MTLPSVPRVPFDLGGFLGAGPGPWVAAVYLGLLPSAAGFVWWSYAVARMPVAVSPTR